MIVDEIIDGKFEEYNENTLKHLKEVLVMMLSDFNDICEENNIEYYLCGGTAIGSMRHGGFIPWDDDIDLMMFRKDYYKLCDVIKNYNDKYDFLSIETTKDYYRFYAKLSLKGTRTHENWDRNTNFKLGIALDIFILDFLPKNKLKQKFFIKKWKLYTKISWFHEISTRDWYLSKNKEVIGRSIKKLLEKIHINQKFLVNKIKKLDTENNGSDEVMILEFGNLEYKFPISIFYPPTKVKFENIEVYNPHDCHNYLKYRYGDYMEIPPKEERENHSFDIDFGVY